MTADETDDGTGGGGGTLRKSLDELLGIAREFLADERLSNDEIAYLDGWLARHAEVSGSFPGDVIHGRVRAALADGVVTREERSHLVETLNELLDDRLDDLAEKIELTELWFDDAGPIAFENAEFCLAGHFVSGPLSVSRAAIERRGGTVTVKVSERSAYLVIGGLGLDEWRSGGLGSEVELAMRLRARGHPIKIIPEGSLSAQLR